MSLNPNENEANRAQQLALLQQQAQQQAATPQRIPGQPQDWSQNQAGYQLYLQQSQAAAQQRMAAQLAANRAQQIPTATGGHGISVAQAQQLQAQALQYRYRTSQGFVQRNGTWYTPSGSVFQPTAPKVPYKYSGGAPVVQNKTMRPAIEIPDVGRVVGGFIETEVRGFDTIANKVAAANIPVASSLANAYRFERGNQEIASLSNRIVAQEKQYKESGEIQNIGGVPTWTGSQEDFAGYVSNINRLEVLQRQNEGLQAKTYGKESSLGLVTYPIYEAAHAGSQWYEGNVSKPFKENYEKVLAIPQVQVMNKFATAAGNNPAISIGLNIAGAASPIPNLLNFRNPVIGNTPEKAFAAEGALIGSVGQVVEYGGMVAPGAEILIRNPATIPAAIGTGLYLQAKSAQEGLTNNPAQFVYENIGMIALIEGARRVATPRVSPIGIESVQIPRVGEMKVRGGTQTTAVQYKNIFGKSVEIPDASKYTVAYLRMPFSDVSKGGRVVFGRATTYDYLPGASTKAMDYVTKVVGKDDLVISQSTKPVTQYKQFFTGQPNEILSRTKISMSSGLQYQEGDIPWTRGQFAVFGKYTDAAAKPQPLKLWTQARDVGYSVAERWTPKQREPFGLDVAQAKPATIKAMLGEFSQYGNKMVSAGSRAQKAMFGGAMREVSASDFDTYMAKSVKPEAYQTGLDIIQKYEGKGFGKETEEGFHLNVRREASGKPEDFFNVHVKEDYPVFSANPMKVSATGGSDVFIMNPKTQVKAKIGGMLQGWKQEPGKQLKLVHNPKRVKDIVDTLSASRVIAADLYAQPVKYDLFGYRTSTKNAYAARAEEFSYTLENYIETDVKRTSRIKPETAQKMTNTLVSRLEKQTGGVLPASERQRVASAVDTYLRKKAPTAYTEAQEMLGTIKFNPLETTERVYTPRTDVTGVSKPTLSEYVNYQSYGGIRWASPGVEPIDIAGSSGHVKGTTEFYHATTAETINKISSQSSFNVKGRGLYFGPAKTVYAGFLGTEPGLIKIRARQSTFKSGNIGWEENIIQSGTRLNVVGRGTIIPPRSGIIGEVFGGKPIPYVEVELSAGPRMIELKEIAPGRYQAVGGWGEFFAGKQLVEEGRYNTGSRIERIFNEGNERDFSQFGYKKILDLGAADEPVSGATHALDISTKEELAPIVVRGAVIEYYEKNNPNVFDIYEPEDLIPNVHKDLKLRAFAQNELTLAKQRIESVDYKFGVDYNKELPYPSNEFDIVHSQGSLGAFGRSRAYSNVFRVLKPGGELITDKPTGYAKATRVPWRVEARSNISKGYFDYQRRFTTMLSNKGYTDIEIAPLEEGRQSRVVGLIARKPIGGRKSNMMQLTETSPGVYRAGGQWVDFFKGKQLVEVARYKLEKTVSDEAWLEGYRTAKESGRDYYAPLIRGVPTQRTGGYSLPAFEERSVPSRYTITPSVVKDVYSPTTTLSYEPTETVSVYSPNMVPVGYTPAPGITTYAPKTTTTPYEPTTTPGIYTPTTRTPTPYNPRVPTPYTPSSRVPQIYAPNVPDIYTPSTKVQASSGTFLTQTSTFSKFSMTSTRLPVRTLASRIYLPGIATSLKLTPTIFEQDRKVKRRRRRGVLVSQWLIKNPVPRISTIYGPYKWRYNVDTPAFGRKFSGSKVIVQSFPGDTTWLKKRGI